MRGASPPSGLLKISSLASATVRQLDGRYWTVSISGIECESDPLLPLTVSPNMPVLALRLTLTVSFEVAPGVVAVTGLVPKLALTPRGRPLTLRFTELEVLIAVMVAIVEPLEPRLTVNTVGEAARLAAACRAHGERGDRCAPIEIKE